MGYSVMCPKGCCTLWAENVTELLKHRDEHSLFMCPCGHNGYVEKSFDLQGEDEHLERFLRGAASLCLVGEAYQPFVYFVSDTPDGKINDVWFAYYYKDSRANDGRLKVEYRPGRPPVLSTNQARALLKTLEAASGTTGADEVPLPIP